jgi:hypothetical protein
VKYLVIGATGAIGGRKSIPFEPWAEENAEVFQ